MKKILLILATATTVFAASAPQTHDGFFLSFAMGLGFQGMDYVTYDYDDDVNGISSLATNIDVKIGFSATQNLAVHLTLAGDTPTESVIETRNGDDVKANMSLLGIGGTYYFPGNFLASASIGVGQFRVCDDIPTFSALVQSSPDDYSRSGLAFQIAGGKEWWVSDNWGIGATASIMYGFETNLADATESSLSFTIRFTATFS
jgi:hypothetical protein